MDDDDDVDLDQFNDPDDELPAGKKPMKAPTKKTKPKQLRTGGKLNIGTDTGKTLEAYSTSSDSEAEDLHTLEERLQRQKLGKGPQPAKAHYFSTSSGQGGQEQDRQRTQPARQSAQSPGQGACPGAQSTGPAVSAGGVQGNRSPGTQNMPPQAPDAAEPNMDFIFEEEFQESSR